MDFENFVKRGQNAQKAVDAALESHAESERVKAALPPATYVNRAGHLKPVKSGPKQYKLGAGLTGKARLQKRVNALMTDAGRVSRKSKDADEVAYAERLAAVLVAFNREAS